DLIKLMEHGFDNSIKAVIRHTTNYSEKEVDYLKIGIEFLGEPSEKILSLIKDKRTRTNGLLPGEYCGLDFEEQIDKLNHIEKENRQLAINLKKNLDELDRIRYMTDVMKVQFIELVDHNLLAC